MSFSEIFTQPLDQNIPSQNRPESTQGPHPASLLQKIKKNCVRSLLLSDSAHFLILWRLGKVQKKSEKSETVLCHCLIILWGYKIFPLAHLVSVQFWNACMEICAHMSICICCHRSRWNLFTPFATDWECPTTPLILIPMLMLNLYSSSANWPIRRLATF